MNAEIAKDTMAYLSLREPKSDLLSILKAWRDLSYLKNIPHRPDSPNEIEALLYRTVEAIEKAES